VGVQWVGELAAGEVLTWADGDGLSAGRSFVLVMCVGGRVAPFSWLVGSPRLRFACFEFLVSGHSEKAGGGVVGVVLTWA
jgi:hypothetical protein